MAATIRDEYRALETLLPHPRNYNVHSEKAVQSLADAMRVVAYTAPIICKEDGTVLGGHARRLALHKLRAESYPEPAGVLAGWQVPCRVVECNEAEELKILATDNPDPAQIDYDQGALAAILSDLQAKDSLDGTWYDAAALDALIAEVGGIDEDVPDFSPVGEDQQGRLDQKAPVTCPHCGESFVPEG
jgi:ParB family chromosome partitioning protein